MSERIIEQDGKRYRQTGVRHEPVIDEWFWGEGDRRLYLAKNNYVIGERDIYELIGETKPMKVTHEEPEQRFETRICDMPKGSIGISRCGLYYYRTIETAACLNSPGASFSPACGITDGVRLLTPGTKITIEVE